MGCLVWKETPISGRLVDLLWPQEPMGRDGFRHSRQTRKQKSRTPCPIFGQACFPGNSQIPDPVNKVIVFPIPAPYFSQIPNPENTLPDPVWWLSSVWAELLTDSTVNKWSKKRRKTLHEPFAVPHFAKLYPGCLVGHFLVTLDVINDGFWNSHHSYYHASIHLHHPWA